MEIGIYTLKGILGVKFPDESLNTVPVLEFLLLFGAFDSQESSIKFEGMTSWTKELKEKVLGFSTKYGEANENAFKLIKLLNKLDENELFFFLPPNSPDLERDDRINLFIELMVANGNTSAREEFDAFLPIYKKMSESYLVTVVRSKGSILKIGEESKEKRVCIFCNLTISGGVSFRKKAHAISESLGNKHLVQNEECDQCNHHFGITIESSLANYLSLFRVMYQVKGKGGTPKYKSGEMVTLENEGESVHVRTRVESVPVGPNSLPKSLELDLNADIQPDHVYKSLVKFCLSSMERTKIKGLDKTLAWIRETDSKLIQLPKVAISIGKIIHAPEPYIVLFENVAGKKDIPYLVGEFHFLMMVFVFIIPFTDHDSIDFSNQAAFDNYWIKMKEYRPAQNWSFHDFSFNQKKKTKYVINLELNTPPDEQGGE
jgi:hypothetical protein